MFCTWPPSSGNGASSSSVFLLGRSSRIAPRSSPFGSVRLRTSRGDLGPEPSGPWRVQSGSGQCSGLMHIRLPQLGRAPSAPANNAETRNLRPCTLIVGGCPTLGFRMQPFSRRTPKASTYSRAFRIACSFHCSTSVSVPVPPRVSRRGIVGRTAVGAASSFRCAHETPVRAAWTVLVDTPSCSASAASPTDRGVHRIRRTSSSLRTALPTRSPRHGALCRPCSPGRSPLLCGWGSRISCCHTGGVTRSPVVAAQLPAQWRLVCRAA